MYFVNWPELKENATIRMNGFFIPTVSNTEFDDPMFTEIYNKFQNFNNGTGEVLQHVEFSLKLTMFNVVCLSCVDLREEIGVVHLMMEPGLEPNLLYITIYNECLICCEFSSDGEYLVGFICNQVSTNDFLYIITCDKIKHLKILLPNKNEYIRE